MEISKAVIIEKAAQIIMNTGLEGLTIQNLAAEMKVEENALCSHLTIDDDILLMLLFGFETDISEFLKEIANKGVSPELELKLLFKGLYFLFQQKPYYLALIYDKSLMKRDERIKKRFLHIKLIAEEYLIVVINKGKKQNAFKTNEPTNFLVNKILAGFKTFMKDEQRLNEMMLELKTLKNIYN